MSPGDMTPEQLRGIYSAGTAALDASRRPFLPVGPWRCVLDPDVPPGEIRAGAAPVQAPPPPSAATADAEIAAGRMTREEFVAAFCPPGPVEPHSFPTTAALEALAEWDGEIDDIATAAVAGDRLAAELRAALAREADLAGRLLRALDERNRAKADLAARRVADPNPVYGFCPKCGAPGSTRERRPDGFDICTAGHRYPSRYATRSGGAR